MPQYKSRLVKVALVNGALGLTGVITPYLFRTILNLVLTAVKSGWSTLAQRQILIALAVLFGIYVAIAIFDYIAERLSDFLFVDIMWEIRKTVFRHLTELSIDYYEQNRPGEIMERISNGTMDFAQWVMALSDGILSSFLTLLFVVIFLWVKLPWIGLIMTVSLSLNFYWAISKVVRVKKIRREWHKFTEKGMGEMSETMSHIATVRSFSQEQYKYNRYTTAIDGYRELRIKQSQIEWSTNFYRALLNAVTLTLVVGVVAYGVFQGKNSPSDILLVLLYLQQMRGSISPLSRLIINTGDLETSAERLTEILDVQPTVTDLPNARALTTLKTIEFKDVSFHYPGKEIEVLKNISFRLEPGKVLALVGPSGVGKTTITKLVMRFYAPTSGQILVNGEPIESFTQSSLRQHIGTVMQDVALFNDTLEENLKFAKPTASEAEIITAAQAAHADQFINHFSDKYQTLVGERGIKLSGGEKQRVAIARAILRDPQLIILDEATSSLDSESEKFVQQGLEKLMKNRTAIVIAHRLSTIRQADQILVLEDGRVVETGTHQELVKNQKLYAKFLALQAQVAKSS